MKKHIILFIAGILTLVLLLVVGDRVFRFGFPWERKDAEQEISDYLTTKFQGQAIVESMMRDFDHGGFCAKAKTVQAPSISFSIYHMGTELVDDYYLEKWNDDINSLVQEQLPGNQFQVWLSLSNTLDMYQKYGSSGIHTANFSTINKELCRDIQFTIHVPCKRSQLTSPDGKQLYQIANILKNTYTFQSISVVMQDDLLPDISYASLQEISLPDFLNGYLDI